MKTTILLLSTFLLLTSAFASDSDSSKRNQPEDSREIKVGNWLTKIIERIINANIPKLANIYIENLNLGDTIGSFSEVHIDHAEEARLLPIEASGLNIKNFTLTLDILNVTGNYNFISLQLPGPIFLNGHGRFSVGLENFTLFTGVALSAPGADVVVSGFPNFTLYLNHSYINFENLMDNEPVGDLLNSIFSDSLPQLVQEADEKIIEELEPILNPLLSAVFTCFKNNLLNPEICFPTGDKPDIKFDEILSLLYNIK